MAPHNFLVAFALLVLPYSGLCQQDLNQPAQNGCGSTPHGGTVVLGNYYYTCNNGNNEPAGCISDTNEKIPVGSTFPRGLYQMKCIVLPDGHMNVEFSACIFQGKSIAPGGTFEADTYWLSCDQQGSFIVQHVSGCMHNGKKFKNNEKTQENDILLQCRDQSPTPKMDEVGCVYKGKEYLIGSQITDDAVWYTCSVEKGKASRRPIGCVHNGKNLFDGQVYNEGDVIFQCRVTEKDVKGAAQTLPYGCVVKQGDTEVLKSFGCKYPGGNSPLKFLMECQKKGDISVSVPMSCLYESNGNEYSLEAGCYRVIGGQGVGCKNGTSGTLEYVQFEKTKVDVATTQGLKLC